MDKQAVIHRLLGVIDRESVNFLGSTSGTSWLGQTSSLHGQLNQAIDTWINGGGNDKIIGVVELMRTMSMLTEPETESLRQAIIVNGEQDKEGIK